MKLLLFCAAVSISTTGKSKTLYFKAYPTATRLLAAILKIAVKPSVWGWINY